MGRMEKRVLLEGGVSVDDVYRFADRAGFLVEQIGDRRGGKPANDLWVHGETGIRLHLVDDRIIGARYLFVEGAGVEATVALAHASLATVTGARALAAFEAAEPAAKVGALYDLGVAADVDDAGVFRAFERAATDADATVRHAAIVAAGYADSPALRKVLGTMVANDPDESVRGDARLMLEALAENDRPPTRR